MRRTASLGLLSELLVLISRPLHVMRVLMVFYMKLPLQSTWHAGSAYGRH